MVTLDSSRRTTKADTAVANILGLPVDVYDSDDESDEDAKINQALMSAVHAFVCRWLPLEYFRQNDRMSFDDTMVRKKGFMETIWQQAHENVLEALTRPSYRSILALYLFGITPVSSTNKQRASSRLCLSTSLRHYLDLRVKSRISPAPALPNRPHTLHPIYGNSTTAQPTDLNFSHLEDTAYWFGIVIDTSRSMIRCQNPILLPGTAGHAQQVWELVRKQVENFHLHHPTLHPSTKSALSEDTVLTILQHGSSCKTLCWASVTGVQDALFYNLSGVATNVAVDSALNEFRRFDKVFSSLLDQCARDFLLLSDKSRVSYCKSTNLPTVDGTLKHYSPSRSPFPHGGIDTK